MIDKRSFIDDRELKVDLGYRHIILRNRANRSEGPASVFCKIKTEIYVPEHQRELRQQFATPLKSLKEQEDMRQAFADPLGASIHRRENESRHPSTNIAGNVSRTKDA